MLNIVHEIFKSSIGKYVAFKWGTLALFIHNLDRFSTDIDLDLLNLEQEADVLVCIWEIAKQFWSVKSMVVWKYLHRRTLSYELRAMNIKIELNKRIRNNNCYWVTNIYGVDCKTMDPQSLATNKLVALYERMANRDLYDTWFFRHHGRAYNEQLIIERTWCTQKELIEKLIIMIPEHYRSNNILFQLGEVLTDKQKNRVKNHLVDSALQLFHFYLSWL
jgi:predicted nucleotidyltransferase component of viral defense system